MFKLNNDSSVSNTSTWLQFFKGCNLPDTIARNYSILFTNNRMKFDMLNELNKELLHEIGICALGDVLSILKHVKELNQGSKNRTQSISLNELSTDVPTTNQHNLSTIPKRIIVNETNSNVKNKVENSNLSSNLMSRLKFKNECNMDTDDNDHAAVIDNNCDSEVILVKTDAKGNRRVIKANDNSSCNQNKLLSLKKPILKRTVNNTASANVFRKNDEKQGQVAIKLLGDFIRKPTVDLKSINNSKTNSEDQSILKRLKF